MRTRINEGWQRAGLFAAMVASIFIFGSIVDNAKAYDINVTPSATVATAITAAVDINPNGGLWIPNGGVGQTTFSLSSADGSIVVNTPGGMSNVGAGSAGQLTVTGTANANFSISTPGAAYDSADASMRVLALYIGNSVIADNTNIIGASVSGVLDGTGTDVIRLGFQGRWNVDNPTPGVKSVTIPVTVNYE